MASVYDFFYSLQSSGFYEFALPFLLVFTIIFAILEKTKLFGVDEDKHPRKNINLIVSIVIGLIVVNQFEIVNRLNLFLPKVSLFIIVAVMFLILVGIFGVNVSEGFTGIALFIFTIISLFIIYWAILPTSASDLFSGGSDIGFWLEDNASLLILVVIVGIIIWAVAGPTRRHGTARDNLDNMFDRWFRGGGHPR